MPRQLRIHLAGGFYHVTLRGNHRQDIFVVESDRNLLNKIVARAIEKYGARVHAYCWMTNHLHFLIQVGAEPLAGPMRQIAAEFARAMQRKLITTGHHFERRYHATLVEADSYLLELIRYIHLNPVRAGLVGDPVHFLWSSHHAYLGKRAESWGTTDFGLQMLSADPSRAVAEYCRFLNCEQQPLWSPPGMNEADAPAVLGSDAFIKGVHEAGGPLGAREKLGDLIGEACRRFAVDRDGLDSPVRDKYLTKVRAWIAYQATQRHIATLSAVARALGRDEATLRQAIRTYPKEVE